MDSVRYGNNIDNNRTGERLEMVRVGDTFKVEAKRRKMEEGARRKVAWTKRKREV